MEKTIEIVVDDKTYISKKINPVRKALIIRDIISKMTPEKKRNEHESVLAMADLIENSAPKVIWEFVKDDDKKIIGTYEKFLDSLEDDSCTAFLKWSIESVNKFTNFLADDK